MSDTDVTFEGRVMFVRNDKFTTAKGKVITTVIVETAGHYPQIFGVKVFGESLTRDADGYTPGCELEIRGKVGGREWKGRPFTDLVATSIKVISGAHTTTADPADPPAGADDLPF